MGQGCGFVGIEKCGQINGLGLPTVEECHNYCVEQGSPVLVPEMLSINLFGGTELGYNQDNLGDGITSIDHIPIFVGGGERCCAKKMFSAMVLFIILSFIYEQTM